MLNEMVRALPEQKPVTSHPSHCLLRRADQAAVGILTLSALVVMILWWAGQGGVRGRQIELQQAEPVDFQFQVDLNSATWQELVLLPGIGETLAMRIIESRMDEGPFSEAADLLRVRGIGPATFERLQPYLTPLGDKRQLADAPSPTPRDG